MINVTTLTSNDMDHPSLSRSFVSAPERSLLSVSYPLSLSLSVCLLVCLSNYFDLMLISIANPPVSVSHVKIVTLSLE